MYFSEFGPAHSGDAFELAVVNQVAQKKDARVSSFFHFGRVPAPPDQSITGLDVSVGFAYATPPMFAPGRYEVFDVCRWHLGSRETG